MFSMPLNKFREGFYSISVLLYDDWAWTSTGAQIWDGNYHQDYFEFYVDQTQDVVASFEIPSERQMGNGDCNDYTGFWVTISVKAGSG